MTTILENRFGMSQGGTIIDADTLAADVTSTILDLRGKSGKCSIQFRFTNNDAVGVLYCKGSNSPDTDHGENLPAFNGATSLAVASGVAEVGLINLETYPRFVWLFWDRTSGTTGNALSAWAEVKK